MSRILDIRGLEAEYYPAGKKVRALRGVDIFLEKGECAGIAGESGCGKSTLAAAVLGLFDRAEGAVTGGSIFFDGKDIAGLSPEEQRELRGMRISLIMQDPYSAFNPVIRLGKQMLETCAAHGTAPSQARPVCLKLLSEVGLSPDVMDSYPHQLSGGMIQRVSIATALLNSPDILIADEPTSNLDVTIQKKIMDNLIELKKKHSLSLLFITHNLNLLASAADRIYILYAGEVVEYGPCRDIFVSPAHPYTRGLIGALPDIREPGRAIRPIPGSVPGSVDLYEECAFHPRCEISSGKCSGMSAMKRVSGEHYARCLR